MEIMPRRDEENAQILYHFISVPLNAVGCVCFCVPVKPDSKLCNWEDSNSCKLLGEYLAHFRAMLIDGFLNANIKKVISLQKKQFQKFTGG